MRYSQLIAPRTSEVVEAPTPDPGPGEVLVRVQASGVCASELHPWADGRPGYPHRFGHEPMGVVVAVGPEVTRFREGDRVTGLFKGAYADLCLAKRRRAAAGTRRRRRGDRPRRAAGLSGQRPAPHAGRARRPGRGDRPGLHGSGHAATAEAARAEPDRRHRRAGGGAGGGQALGADEVYDPSELPDEYSSPILATGRATAGSTSSSKGPAPSPG